MTWRSLFISRANGTGGTFITPQTLTSFAGASAVIGITCRIYLALVPGSDFQTVSTSVAVIVGIVIFVMNVTDEQVKPPDLRSWFIASIVGIINTIFLIAVTLGIFESFIVGTL